MEKAVQKTGTDKEEKEEVEEGLMGKRERCIYKRKRVRRPKITKENGPNPQVCGKQKNKKNPNTHIYRALKRCRERHENSSKLQKRN